LGPKNKECFKPTITTKALRIENDWLYRAKSDWHNHTDGGVMVQVVTAS